MIFVAGGSRPRKGFEVDEEKASVQDFCDQGCLQRLQIRDHQIERQEKAIQRLEVVIEAVVDIVVQNHPESFQRKIDELTAKILEKTGDPKPNGDKDEGISAWD